MKKGVKPVKERELKRIQAISTAAASLFDEKGYIETTLKDISDKAELSKGCIYHYFDKKEDILFHILDTYMDHLIENLEEDLRDIDGSEGKIEYVMSRHLSLYNKNVPEAKAILLDAHNLSEEYYDAIAEKQKKYAQILTVVLSEYMGQSIDKEILKAISFICFGMCNSIMHWHNPKGSIKLDQLSKICFGVFMNGISQYAEG